jgi:hypothetical protein
VTIDSERGSGEKRRGGERVAMGKKPTSLWVILKRKIYNILSET